MSDIRETPEKTTTSAATSTPTLSSAPETAGRAEILGQDSAPRSAPAPEAMTPALALQMRAFRNARYHEDREAFFNWTNRLCNFLVLLMGSAAVIGAISAVPNVSLIGGAASAIIGAAQLVYDFGGRARTHQELRREFLRIQAKAARPGADPDSLNGEMVKLYRGEPETYHAVNALAYNAAQMAFNRPASTLVHVDAIARFFRNFWTFEPNRFPDVAS